MKDEGGRMKKERPAMLRANSSFIPHPSSLFRRGYSFTEVMFAVVVLGIGFIMIAAMFPVAISQSKLTQEETNAASIARGAATYVQSIATRYNMPATGTAAQPNRPRVYSVRDPQMGAGPALNTFYAGDNAIVPPTNTEADSLWDAVKGNLILASDPRYACVLLYRRSGVGNAATPGVGGTAAQVFVIACQVRGRSTYAPNPDVTFTPATAAVNLQARPITVTQIEDNVGGSGVDWITFADLGPLGATNAVAEGTYVVIADDPGDKPANVGFFNGRIYRVGSKATPIGASTPTATTWELQAGSDYKIDPGPDFDISTTGDNVAIGADAGAWIVGREPDTETAAADDYRGTAQDIAIYTTFVPLK
jgi:Tfp pilus assembly protein PilV